MIDLLTIASLFYRYCCSKRNQFCYYSRRDNDSNISQ